MNFLLSARLVTLLEISEKNGSWEEVYIAFLQDLLCFVFLILLPGQALQTTTSEECQSKEEPKGKEDTDHICFMKN